MVDLICTCGHLDTDHSIGWFEHVRCFKEDSFNIKKPCRCTKFSLDNLLYLEQLDKEYYLGNRS